MSRRTKLIIVVIFLVLLAIPAGYVAISWHPANPLQFRLKSIGGIPEGRINSSRAPFTIQVSIKNGSPFPIHFYGATGSLSQGWTVYQERGGSTMRIHAEAVSGSPGALHTAAPELCIPAHSEIDVTGLLGPELRDSMHESTIYVRGGWQSHTRKVAADALFWMRDHVPQWARNSIPELHPFDEAVTLEPKGHAPAQPPAPVPSAP